MNLRRIFQTTIGLCALLVTNMLLAQPVLSPIWSTPMCANYSYWSADGTRFITWNHLGASIRESVSGKLVCAAPVRIRSIALARYAQHGMHLLFSSADSTAKVWDLQTGTILREFKGHDCIVNSAVFNKSGTRVLTSGSDGRCMIWDAQSGRLIRTIKVGNMCYNAIFCESEDRFIYSTRDVQYLADTSGNLIHYFETQGAIVPAIWTAANDRRVFLGSSDVCFVADIDSINPIARISGYVLPGTSASDTLFDANINGGFCTYTCLSAKQLRLLKPPPDCAYNFTLSPDRRFAVINSPVAPDSAILLLDYEQGTKLASLNLDTRQQFNTISFSPDSKYVIASGWENHTGIWSTETYKKVYEVPSSDERVVLASFSPDGKHVAIGTNPTKNHESYILHDAATGEKLKAFTEIPFRPYNSVFTKNSKYVAVSSITDTVYVYDVEAKQLVSKIGVIGAPIRDLLLSKDASKIVVSTQIGPDGVYSVQSGKRLFGPKVPYWNASLQWSDDESKILSKYNDNCYLWSSTDGSRLTKDMGCNFVWTGIDAAIISADGNTIVAGRGIFDYFDANTTYWLGRVNQGHSLVQCLSLAANGKRVMTCSMDGEVRVADNKTDAPRVFKAPGSKVLYADMSRGGEMLVIGTDSGYTAILDASNFKELARLSSCLIPGTRCGFNNQGDKLMTTFGSNEAVFVWDLSSIKPVVSLPADVPKSSYMLYPMPADQVLHISCEGLDPEPVNLDIFSMFGELVSSEKLNVTMQSSAKLSSDVSMLPSGAYAARISTATHSQTCVFLVCH